MTSNEQGMHSQQKVPGGPTRTPAHASRQNEDYPLLKLLMITKLSYQLHTLVLLLIMRY